MLERIFDSVPFNRNKIYKITSKEFEILFERKEERDFDDRNLYIMTKHSTNEIVYVAIDNLAGDFFIEEFKNYNDAILWLTGLKEAGPLQKAEESEFWY